MKDYVVIRKDSISQDVVGSFDTYADAGQFALLSKMSNPIFDYSVFEKKDIPV